MLDYGTRPTTFPEVVMGAEQHFRTVRNTVIDDYRKGQAFWNYVEHWYPEVTAELVGTPIDPFHQDSRVNAFVAAIQPYFE